MYLLQTSYVFWTPVTVIFLGDCYVLVESKGGLSHTPERHFAAPGPVTKQGRPCCCSMPLEEVVCLAYSVAAALQWTHSKQVVHQDVHAGNILQTLDGYEWRLADFGNAAWMYAADGSQTRLTSSWYALLL